jgi:hypothetical protein
MTVKQISVFFCVFLVPAAFVRIDCFVQTISAHSFLYELLRGEVDDGQ